MGLGEGTTFPALSALLASWIPLKERSKLGSFVFGGGQVWHSFFSCLFIYNDKYDKNANTYKVYLNYFFFFSFKAIIFIVFSSIFLK